MERVWLESKGWRVNGNGDYHKLWVQIHLTRLTPCTYYHLPSSLHRRRLTPRTSAKAYEEVRWMPTYLLTDGSTRGMFKLIPDGRFRERWIEHYTWRVPRSAVGCELGLMASSNYAKRWASIALDDSAYTDNLSLVIRHRQWEPWRYSDCWESPCRGLTMSMS